MAESTSVLFVCLGNICRSPMADALLRHKLDRRGLGERFEVDSAGTAAYHVGEPPHPGTQAVLRRHGVPVVGRARQVVAQDFVRFDHVLAMDRSNLARLRRQCPAPHAPKLHLALAPTSGGDVPDPYDQGDPAYTHVYQLLDEALEAWIERWSAG